jgi:outer membrane protein assembly factor BamD (BamD/ComL family)
MKHLPLILLIAFLAACSNSKEQLQKNITTAETELFGNDKGAFTFDEKLVAKTIEAYEAFVKAYPEDSMSAEYLFKQADLYRSLKDGNKAIKNYNRIIDKYPTYTKTPYCVFLKGFIYENELNNITKAKEAYQYFLDTYPSHELADDVQFSLKNLGKSPEEIIKEIEEQQQQMLSDTSNIAS